MYCSEATLVNLESRSGTAVTLRCRSWSCPLCCDMRRRQLQALALAGEPTKFLTLTSRRNTGLTPPQAARQLAHAAQILYRQIIRKFGKDKVSWLSVFEKTKNGWPHLHILCRMPYVPQAWLSRRMRELIDAPVVDIRALHNVRTAAAYVSKYIAKDPTRFEGCKRYWRSLDWDLGPADEDAPVIDRGKGWKPDRRSMPNLLWSLQCLQYGTRLEGDKLHFWYPWPRPPPFERELLHRPR